MGECDYAGFCDGEFLVPEDLSYVIGRALTSAETNSRLAVKHLYIGVPGEFTTCACREVNMALGRKRAVLDSDVDALFDNGNVYRAHSKYTLINIQPIYFTLDDDRRLVQPVGLKSGRLGGLVSYTLAETKFLDFIDKIITELGIETHEYVSSLLAETLFLFDEEKRDRYAVLIDCGHITTNVVVARGDGILQQFNFSLGGGHVTGDLANYLGISFAEAESLKRKVVLSLDVNADDVYEINTRRDEAKTFPADVVNEIVMSRINTMAKTISKCLNMCGYDYPDFIPYHLTGGGLSYVKGARDYLSKQLKKPVELIAPSLPQFNRPHLSSAIGLLNMVLEGAPQKIKKGFFAKLFSK
jgi:cell division protein FtsA